MKPDTALIIVTFNAMPWLERCLTSIRESSEPVTVFVVDNASTDQSVSFIQAQFPEVQVIASTKNLGFGKANNIALWQAYQQGYTYFLLLNQDTWLGRFTIQCLVKAAQLHPFGVISCLHLNATMREYDRFFLHYVKGLSLPDPSDVVLEVTCKEITTPYTVPFVNAALWLLPRTTLETVGGFNPYFAHYGEDNDYIHRVHFHKLEVGIITNTYVVHDRPQAVLPEKKKKLKQIAEEVHYMNPLQQVSKQQMRSLFIQQTWSALTSFRWYAAWYRMNMGRYIQQRWTEIMRYKERVLQKEQLLFLKP